VKGNYTPDEDRTWLGIGGEIGVGFVPYVSTVASARDLTFDLSHWKWSWGHALQTTGDVVGLIPFARGFVKSAGAESRTVRGVGKAATAGLEAGQAAKALARNADEAADTANQVAKNVGIRNGHLAGKSHPVTGIPFDPHGFPDFSGVATHTVKIEQTGNYAADFLASNRAAGLRSTPKGYTWHHHQDGTTMQLVPTDIHSKTGHTGGMATGALQ
jgi:hypothetical protein